MTPTASETEVDAHSSASGPRKSGGPPWWSLLTLAIGWLPGIYAWRWWNDAGGLVVGSKLKTALSQEQRHDALLWGACSLGVVVSAYILSYLVRRRRRNTQVRFADHCRALNGFFLFILLVPFLAAILGGKLESTRDFSNLSLIAVAGFLFCTWVYLLLPARVADTLPSRDPWAWPVRAGVPWFAVLAMLGLYAARFSYLSVLDHHGLRTAAWDLGIYDNIVYKTARGDFLGCSYCTAGKHYTAHFDPILALFGPIHRLYPRAETLLVLQSVWLALGGIPLFMYAKRKLEQPWWALCIVAAYYLTAALHGVNLYDFHSLALLIPTAFFAIYFLDSERWVAYALSIVVLLLTREDLALLSIFIALYAWSMGHRRAALVTVVVAVIYFAVVRLFVMGEVAVLLDQDADTKSFVWYYKELIPFPKEGALGLVITALTDPAMAWMVLFSEKKLLYFLKLLVPLLFLPLIGGRKRILLLYGLLFLGLATRPYVFSTNFQYSSLVIPFLLLAAVDGVAGLRDSRLLGARVDPGRLQRALLLGVVLASALTATDYGALRENLAFRGGFERIRFDQTPAEAERLAELRDMIARIPPDAGVSTGKSTGPHLSSRAYIVQWPKVGDSDYALLKIKGRKYTRSRRYKDLLKRGVFEIEHESPNFVLLRRTRKADDAQDDLEEAHEDPKDESHDPRRSD